MPWPHGVTVSSTSSAVTAASQRADGRVVHAHAVVAEPASGAQERGLDPDRLRPCVTVIWSRTLYRESDGRSNRH